MMKKRTVTIKIENTKKNMIKIINLIKTTQKIMTLTNIIRNIDTKEMKKMIKIHLLN